MALTYVTHNGDGSTTSFSYASLASKLLSTDLQPVSSQLDVYVGGTLSTLTTDYTVDTVGQEIDFVSAPASGTANVKIQRAMDRNNRVIDFTSVSILKASDIDDAIKQVFYLMQEIIDDFDDALRKADDGIWDAQSIRIKNVATGVNGSDAVNLSQLNAAVSGVLPVTIASVPNFTATGDASTTTWVITGGPASASVGDYIVTVNGLMQDPTTHYTITPGDPDSIVFTTAPASGDKIVVRWITGTVVGTLSDDAVTTAKILDGAVTEAKIDGTGGTANQVLMTNGTTAAFTTVTPTHVSGFDTQVRTSRLDQMAAPTSSISMGSNKITSLGTPTSSTDAATKAYVDTKPDAEYQAVTLTAGSATSTLTTTISVRKLTVSWNAGAGDVTLTCVFGSAGDSYAFTANTVTYTLTKVSTSSVTITRSNTTGTLNFKVYMEAE